MQSRVFTHPQRDRIDTELLAGVGYRTISAWSGISIGALSRYRVQLKQTLGLALRERSEGEREEHAGQLLGRVEELVEECKEVLTNAKAEKDLKGAVAAIGAATRLLELVGRLSGELATPNTPGIHLSLTSNRVTVNNYEAGSDIELAMLISEATDAFNPATIEHLKSIAEGQRTDTNTATSWNPVSNAKQLHGL